MTFHVTYAYCSWVWFKLCLWKSEITSCSDCHRWDQKLLQCSAYSQICIISHKYHMHRQRGIPELQEVHANSFFSNNMTIKAILSAWNAIFIARTTCESTLSKVHICHRLLTKDDMPIKSRIKNMQAMLFNSVSSSVEQGGVLWSLLCPCVNVKKSPVKTGEVLPWSLSG